MDVQRMIDALNKSLALEYAALIQYSQCSFLLQGPEREYLVDFFRDTSKRILETHVQRLGGKIVALGGLPTVEPATIHQAADFKEMLRQALELEREAQKAHHGALKLLGEKDEAPAETALRHMLQEMVEDEQREIDALELLLATKQLGAIAKEVRLKSG
ncbi:MAG: ferritin-like domain-containing protein [Deltaproteobacteria bacterium]|nr:ferritin-like domain-containing protein [Deltaproteobacteria bacterium]